MPDVPRLTAGYTVPIIEMGVCHGQDGVCWHSD